LTEGGKEKRKGGEERGKEATGSTVHFSLRDPPVGFSSLAASDGKRGKTATTFNRDRHPPACEVAGGKERKKAHTAMFPPPVYKSSASLQRQSCQEEEGGGKKKGEREKGLSQLDPKIPPPMALNGGERGKEKKDAILVP